MTPERSVAICAEDVLSSDKVGHALNDLNICHCDCFVQLLCYDQLMIVHKETVIGEEKGPRKTQFPLSLLQNVSKK